MFTFIRFPPVPVRYIPGKLSVQSAMTAAINSGKKETALQRILQDRLFSVFLFLWQQSYCVMQFLRCSRSSAELKNDIPSFCRLSKRCKRFSAIAQRFFTNKGRFLAERIVSVSTALIASSEPILFCPCDHSRTFVFCRFIVFIKFTLTG